MLILLQTLREAPADTWLISLLVGCMSLLAIASYIYNEAFKSFVQLPLTNQYFIIAGKQRNALHPFTLLLFVIGLAGLALFFTFSLAVFQAEEYLLEFRLFAQVLAAVFGFFVVRFLLDRLLGIVFKLELLMNGYVFEKLTFLNLIGLGLLIASLVGIYGFNSNPWVLYIAAGLAVVGYVVGLIYSYKNNEKLIFSNFFYFILYLCALEISPFILAYKVLS